MVKVNLFFNWYKNPERQHEIDFCLQKNREVFDNVTVVQGRPTFDQLFQATKLFSNSVNCFCNSDIYFTDLSQIRNIKENECYALSRYDQKDGYVSFFNRADSQDAWVFKGAVKNVQAPFPMGLWGCDNRLAYEIKRAGYDLKNPSLSIKTIHLHAIDRRNHKRTPENTVPGPYLCLTPTA